MPRVPLLCCLFSFLLGLGLGLGLLVWDWIESARDQQRFCDRRTEYWVAKTLQETREGKEISWHWYREL